MDINSKLSDKVEAFGGCITRTMSIKAMEAGALNLAQGFPTEDPPTPLLEAAIGSIKGHRNYYADMRGDPKLRDAVAAYTKRFNGLEACGDNNVTITCGTTEAMIATFMAIINPGDEIILFEPWYENYMPQTILAGAKVKFFTLEPPEYLIDLDRLKTLFSNKTKAIVINTPNNPTGRVFTHEELSGIAHLCQKYDALAIVDEIYQHIVFDDNQHISLASLDGMSERTITINGISKAYAATGWRIGWAIAPYELTLAVRRVHDFLTGAVPTPFQDAAVVGLNLDDSFFDGLKQTYTKRRASLAEWLTQAGFSFFLPEGAYYILADIGGFGFSSSEEFAETLIRDAGVAVVPGIAYFADPKWRERTVRFTFSKPDEVIRNAGLRLYEWSPQALSQPFPDFTMFDR